MNILITGANGQLGNAFIAGRRVDVVVNCAAYTAVDKAEDNPELCDRLNHLAPGYLAEAAEAMGAALIQVSTDYVFDGTAHVPYREDDTPCPNSVYGRTKLAGEEVVMQKCSRAMIVRTAWLYSTFGNNFVKTMLRLGRERESLGVVFDQIGTPTYAADLAQAIFAAIEQERAVELIGEGQRSFDLRRWRTIEKAFGVTGPGYAGYYCTDTYGGRKQQWYVNPTARDIQRAYIFAIPQSERDRNPNMSQNTPWL